MSEQTARDALNEAFDAQDEEVVEEVVEAPEVIAEVIEEEPEIIEPATVEAEEPVLLEAETEVPAEPVVKAPASWTPAERELWGGVDPSLQTRILSREKEVSDVLTRTADARRHFEEFNSVTGPFQGLMAAEGATPMQAVQTLLGTAATLQTGSPVAKAQRVAELITHYGVDVQALADVIGGQAPQDPQQDQFSQMLDQRLGPINQFLSQQQQQQQQQYQQAQTETQTETDQFMSTHDFAEDVRNDMADILEMAAKRGQNMTLEECYEKAILLRPDIQQIIEQRKAAANASQQNAAMRQKESASVSVAGGGSMLTGDPQPTNTREALEAAWGK